MAVFTAVPRERLDAWIARYRVGRVLTCEGISAGIENSNFFVDTETGRWVLTLFERLPADDLPFYLGLMQHLAARGIPCPNPVADRDGSLSSPLQGRPATLVTRLAGRPLEHPEPAHCAQVGELLATMHRDAQDYAGTLPNPRGLLWCQATAQRLLSAPSSTSSSVLSSEQVHLLRDELQAQRGFANTPQAAALPCSAVHADLFRDNVLFEADRLSGVVDFYFAGVDTWLFDVAVTCNDWCIDALGQFEPARLQALLRAYHAVRPLQAVEHAAWPLQVRRAALRFWLSRLDDLHGSRPAELLEPKDPAHFERILRARRAGVPALDAVL